MGLRERVWGAVARALTHDRARDTLAGRRWERRQPAEDSGDLEAWLEVRGQLLWTLWTHGAGGTQKRQSMEREAEGSWRGTAAASQRNASSVDSSTLAAEARAQRGK